MSGRKAPIWDAEKIGECLLIPIAKTSLLCGAGVKVILEVSEF